MNTHTNSLLLLARHFWVIKYWQTAPNTRTVSHRALVKTQKASDSFVWAGFIASWFVTSPALTSHYTWIDFTCASIKTYITQSSPLKRQNRCFSSVKHRRRASVSSVIPVISIRSSQINPLALWLLNWWLMAICVVKSTKLTHTDSSNCSSVSSQWVYVCARAQFGIGIQGFLLLLWIRVETFSLSVVKTHVLVYLGLILLVRTGMISDVKYTIYVFINLIFAHGLLMFLDPNQFSFRTGFQLFSLTLRNKPAMFALDECVNTPFTSW